MEKKQTITIILLVLGLIFILNFISWATPNVIQETSNAQFSPSVMSKIIPLFSGILIVGIAAIWIFVVMKR